MQNRAISSDEPVTTHSQTWRRVFASTHYLTERLHHPSPSVPLSAPFPVVVSSLCPLSARMSRVALPRTTQTQKSSCSPANLSKKTKTGKKKKEKTPPSHSTQSLHIHQLLACLPRGMGRHISSKVRKRESGQTCKQRGRHPTDMNRMACSRRPRGTHAHLHACGWPTCSSRLASTWAQSITSVDFRSANAASDCRPMIPKPSGTRCPSSTRCPLSRATQTRSMIIH